MLRIDNLFQPFVQVGNNISSRFGGTGLGLSNSKNLAIAMGGDIFVKSAPNIGSEFWVELPFEIANEKLVENLNQGEDFEAQNYEENPIKILAADDNAANLFIIGKFLETIGANIDLVNDGQEALKKAAINSYDVILLDVRMPIMDGLTACKKIRKESALNKNTPIIMISADAEKDQIAIGLKAGADTYLPNLPHCEQHCGRQPHPVADRHPRRQHAEHDPQRRRQGLRPATTARPMRLICARQPAGPGSGASASTSPAALTVATSEHRATRACGRSPRASRWPPRSRNSAHRPPARPPRSPPPAPGTAPAADETAACTPRPPAPPPRPPAASSPASAVRPHPPPAAHAPRRAPAATRPSRKLERATFNRDGEERVQREPDEQPSPERLALARIDAGQVAKALETLPEGMRSAIVLFHVHGASYEEIAETLAMAGGPSRSADTSAMEVIRVGRDGKLRRIPVNFDDIETRSRPEATVIIVAGDTIHVP